MLALTQRPGSTLSGKVSLPALRLQPGAAPGSYRQQLGSSVRAYRDARGNRIDSRAGTLKALIAVLVGTLTGCATQGPYQAPPLEAPTAWSLPAADAALAMPVDGPWWQQLDDPGIDALIEAALADSPTLAHALARVDEARAMLGSATAQGRPSVGLEGGATRTRSLDTGSDQDITALSTTASAGASLAWEVDLFGRVRHSVQASRQRLVARDADAQAARLVLTAQISDDVLAWRGCAVSIMALQQDVDSREKTLALTQARLQAGFVAPLELARAQSGLAMARTTIAARQQTCAEHLNALVAATGQSRTQVHALISPAPPTAGASGDGQELAAELPAPPPVQVALPATVLAAHPAVVAAERETAAAWSDIAVARAERWPRLDLLAALSGQWLRAAGTTVDATTWSIGPAVTVPLFDGGRGAAKVSAAEARYQGAVAQLRLTVRSAAQDVENAMAAVESATTRRETTQTSVASARQVLAATLAQWEVGAVSLFEVEDARRQLSAAQEAAITAAYDSRRAWVALVRASGHALAPHLGQHA